MSMGSQARAELLVVQKRSVEYGPASMQDPALQSASERHGEQKLPSPTHTPARGTHVLTGWQVAPPAQAASLAHSGVHLWLSQCWYTPPAGGQSSSLAHLAPAPGVHMLHCPVQAASKAQLALVAQTGAQKLLPWLSATQCAGTLFAVCDGAQSLSERQGVQYARGRHTLRVTPGAGRSVVTFGASLTVAHHQPCVQFASLVHANNVQNALASVVLWP
jgi:hypothetical protein